MLAHVLVGKSYMVAVCLVNVCMRAHNNHRNCVRVGLDLMVWPYSCVCVCMRVHSWTGTWFAFMPPPRFMRLVIMDSIGSIAALGRATS